MKFVDRLCRAIIICIVIFCVKNILAANYEYKGIYSVESVMTSYCEDCFLQLPIEYLQSNFILSVNTDNEKDLFKSLVAASKSIGWDLKKSGKNLIAEPIQNDGQLVYISCMNFEPVNVPKYLYSYAKKSDSLKCALRDSLNLVQINVNDSLNKLKDSLEQIKLPFKEYELRYYSYSKNFIDKIGFDWQEILASGNLHNKFKIYDDWAFFATSNNDTTFNFRQINVKIDSSLSIDWGTEEQTLLNSYVNDGVTSNNYEWRKYGLIVNLRKDEKRVKLDYIFRDKENSISVLQGSAVSWLNDTLKVSGQYTANRNVIKGIPILSSIPIINYFFATNQTINDLRNFELYLIPKNGEKKDE